jgi:hypothetical protein
MICVLEHFSAINYMGERVSNDKTPFCSFDATVLEAWVAFQTE